MKFLVALRVAPMLTALVEDDLSAAVPKWNPFPTDDSPGRAIFAILKFESDSISSNSNVIGK